MAETVSTARKTSPPLSEARNPDSGRVTETRNVTVHGRVTETPHLYVRGRVTETLYLDVLALFTALVDSAGGGNRQSNESLTEELGRLFLWGESFRGGKLDMIAESYPDLRLSIRKLLVSLSKALITSEIT